MLTICEAVKERIEKLLKENNITAYRLALNSGIAHGVLSLIMNTKNNGMDFSTILKLAGGFDMTVSEFLDDPLFNEDNLKL